MTSEEAEYLRRRLAVGSAYPAVTSEFGELIPVASGLEALPRDGAGVIALGLYERFWP